MLSRTNEPTITYGQMNLLFNIRNLWRQLVTWTRSYLMSRFAGLDIADEVFNRLYRIPREFGNILELILGPESAQSFIQYLSVQLALTKEIIDAYVAGNPNLVNEKVKELYRNADIRAKLMASYNPFWDEEQIRNFLYTYHRYTLEEIITLLTGEYSKNIDIYDRLLNHADIMGDYFTEGIYNYLTSKS